MGLVPRTPGSCPKPKTDTQALIQPGAPRLQLLMGRWSKYLWPCLKISTQGVLTAFNLQMMERVLRMGKPWSEVCFYNIGYRARDRQEIWSGNKLNKMVVQRSNEAIHARNSTSLDYSIIGEDGEKIRTQRDISEVNQRTWW